MELLARRLGEDFEAGFQRVVAVDQGEMRAAALEQPDEQALEVAVDLVECCSQPFPALAVEVADRTAQTVDRLDQFGLFAGAGSVLFLDPGELVCCHEVDRADPFAAGGQAVHFLRFCARISDLSGLEVEPFGEHGRRALEALARYPCHFAPARLFILCPRSEAGTRFTRGCESFVRLGKIAISLIECFLALRNDPLCGGQLFAQLRAHDVALLDFLDQPLRLGGNDGTFLLDFLEPVRCVGHPCGGFSRTLFPVRFFGALRSRPFARHGQSLVMRGKFRCCRLHR